MHAQTHVCASARVLLSAIIYMTCGLYDSTQGEILEELSVSVSQHTHTHHGERL